MDITKHFIFLTHLFDSTTDGFLHLGDPHFLGWPCFTFLAGGLCPAPCFYQPYDVKNLFMETCKVIYWLKAHLDICFHLQVRERHTLLDSLKGEMSWSGLYQPLSAQGSPLGVLENVSDCKLNMKSKKLFL